MQPTPHRSLKTRVSRFALLLVAAALGSATNADARPERIRAGMSYYSDDYVVEGMVHDIADEKNYEEVYQFYTYYEAIYDEAGRVKEFVEYERGDEVRREKYDYADDDALVRRTVVRPGQPPEVTGVAPEPSDAAGETGEAEPGEARRESDE